MSKLYNSYTILSFESDDDEDQDDILFDLTEQVEFDNSTGSTDSTGSTGSNHSICTSYDMQIDSQSKSTQVSNCESESKTNKSNKIRRFGKKGFCKSYPNLNSKIYSGLKFLPGGVLDEFTGLPETIGEAIRLKRNLTLKQIISIVEYDGLKLFGLYGEMFNVIHDRIQLKVRRRKVKITHQGRFFSVSLYNWYDLKQIEKMIGEIVFGK
jgi:hypothetical protein